MIQTIFFSTLLLFTEQEKPESQDKRIASERLLEPPVWRRTPCLLQFSSAEGGRGRQALPCRPLLSGLIVTTLSPPETPACAGSPTRAVQSAPSAQPWEPGAT